jgi:hypothetical protein
LWRGSPYLEVVGEHDTRAAERARNLRIGRTIILADCSAEVLKVNSVDGKLS